jgi:Arc/MetJ family transcription regulator
MVLGIMMLAMRFMMFHDHLETKRGMIMRTTVSLDDQLLAMAKREALKHHRSLASLVEEALRQMLASSAAASQMRRHVELPESGEGGLQPGIDLDSTADLLLVMEKRDDSLGR